MKDKDSGYFQITHMIVKLITSGRKKVKLIIFVKVLTFHYIKDKETGLNYANRYKKKLVSGAVIALMMTLLEDFATGGAGIENDTIALSGLRDRITVWIATYGHLFDILVFE